jgi:hypothetical protein
LIDRARAVSTHPFQDLKQAPTLAAITLRMQHAFALEIDLIDQRVTALGSAGHALELLLHILAFRRRRFIEHFGQGVSEAFDQEFRLKIDGVGQKLAQFLHFGRLLTAKKLTARIPWTWKFARTEKYFRQLGAATGNETDQLGKTFLKWATLTLRVPNEVTDSQRSEVFSFVPRGQTGHGAVAFILPDFLADPKGFGVRQRDGRERVMYERSGQKNRQNRSAQTDMMLSP